MDFLDTMRAVWADSLDGIVIADADTVIVDVNPAYCRLAGYNRQQLIGQKTNVIRSGQTPRSVFEDMWRSLGATGKWVGELINKRPDGSLWISFLSVTRVVTPDGGVAGYVGIARDMTERRHLEDQLRHQTSRLSAVLEAIASGVFMFDRSDHCVVSNQNMARLLGSESEYLIGKSREELQGRLGAIFREENILSQPEDSGTCTISTREERPRYFTVRWAPVFSEAAQGQIVTIRDITRETEVDRMKSEFIATVSHELRTPMTSVKGALGLLLGGATGPVTEAQQELLTIAQNNIDRLIRLINDILDLSRIESGRVELRLQPMEINDVVAEALRELESVQQARGLDLRVDLAPDLPPVNADADRIGQVLTNLLGNAYKFTESGGHIVVRSVRVGDEVQVSVSDTGPGIAADQLQTIFERFQRVAGASSRRAGGTGLGLAIAKAIIQEHKGRIWVESEVGRGAVFTFSIPLPRMATQPDPEAPTRGSSQAVAMGQAPTVLVCDDDTDIVKVLSMALEQEGFHVLSAGSGEEALRICNTHRVDCISLDLLMPDMHGLEVAHHLKTNPATRNIPVVVVSAYTDQHRDDLALLGITGVVPKPVDRSQLLEQIGRAVGDSRRGEGPPEVLVVDDDPTMLRVVELTLQEAGYRVRTASDGTSAFAAIQDHLPDALVADVLMPNLDGFRLVRMLQMHAHTRHIPLLVLTALDLTASERGVLQLGPTAHLSKGPRLREQLVTRVKELVSSRGKHPKG